MGHTSKCTKALILVLVLAVIGASASKDTSVLTNYASAAQKDLKTLFASKSGAGLDIAAVYYSAYTVFASEGNAQDVLTSQQCAAVDAFKPQNVADAYFKVRVANLFGTSAQCKINVGKNDVNSLLNTSEDNNSFLDFYYSLSTLIDLGDAETAADACVRLNDFLLEDGSVRATKTSESGQYSLSGHIYEAFSKCLKLRTTASYTKKITQKLTNAIKSVFLNAYDVAFDELAILERAQSTIATAAVTRALSDLLEADAKGDSAEPFALADAATTFKREYQVRLVKYVRSALHCALDAYTPEERYELARFAYQLRDFALVVVREQGVLGTRARVEVPFRVENVAGKRLPLTTTGDLQSAFGTVKVLNRDQKSVQGVDVKVRASEANDAQWPYAFVVDSSAAQKALVGAYTLRVEKRDGALTRVQAERVNFVTKATPTGIEFEVIKGRGTPSQYTHQIAFTDSNAAPVALTESSFVAFRFRLEWDKDVEILPAQAGIVLRHPTYQYVAAFVPARYDAETRYWTLMLDLGDPDQILPYSATYEADLVVGDQSLKDGIRWTFAKFAINFKKPRTQAPPSDLDYTVPTEIQHTFPQPQKEPPFFFVSFYLLMIGASFYAFLRLLKVLGVNLNRIPKNFDQQLPVYVFLGGLGVLFGILLLFWLKINLIQTLTLLAAYVIPFFLVGNYALGLLNKQDDE